MIRKKILRERRIVLIKIINKKRFKNFKKKIKKSLNNKKKLLLPLKLKIGKSALIKLVVVNLKTCYKILSKIHLLIRIVLITNNNNNLIHRRIIKNGSCSQEKWRQYFN